jgi:hypothetical protein
MKKLFLLTLFMIILLPIVFAGWGVTSPNPDGLSLLPGERGRFYFQIQAVNEASDLECEITPAKGDLDVIFDENPVNVEKGKMTTVYGTALAPTDQSLVGQKVERAFCVKCKGDSDIKDGNAVVEGTYCLDPFSVMVEGEVSNRRDVEGLRAPSEFNRVTDKPENLGTCLDVPSELRDACLAGNKLVEEAEEESKDIWLLIIIVLAILAAAIYLSREKPKRR